MYRSQMVMQVDGQWYEVHLSHDNNLYFAAVTLVRETHVGKFMDKPGVVHDELPTLVQLIQPNGDAYYPLQEHEDKVRSLISVYRKIPPASLFNN